MKLNPTTLVAALTIAFLFAGRDEQPLTTSTNSSRNVDSQETHPITKPSRPVARAGGGHVLEVAETNLWPLPKAVEFSLRGVWRYDPDADRWARIIKVSMPQSVTIEPIPAEQPGAGPPARRLLELPEQIGLYWVTWTEDGTSNGCFVFNGPVLPQDLELGDPPPGRVAAGVPFEDSARAQFVPDPHLHCR